MSSLSPAAQLGRINRFINENQHAIEAEKKVIHRLSSKLAELKLQKEAIKESILLAHQKERQTISLANRYRAIDKALINLEHALESAGYPTTESAFSQPPVYVTVNTYNPILNQITPTLIQVD